MAEAIRQYPYWHRKQVMRAGWDIFWLSAHPAPGRGQHPPWVETPIWRGVQATSKRLPAFFMPIEGRLMVSKKGRRMIEAFGDPELGFSPVTVRVAHKLDQDLCWEIRAAIKDVTWHAGIASIARAGEVLVDETGWEPRRNLFLTHRHGTGEVVVVVSDVGRKLMERASAGFDYHEVVTVGSPD